MYTRRVNVVSVSSAAAGDPADDGAIVAAGGEESVPSGAVEPQAQRSCTDSRRRPASRYRGRDDLMKGWFFMAYSP